LVELTPNALKVLEVRYLKKDGNGKVIETPEEMFRRVAGTVASAERTYGEGEEVVRRVENDFYDISPTAHREAETAKAHRG